MIARENTAESKLIRRHLEKREATHFFLAEVLGVHFNTAKRHCRRLHELGRIHIVAWHCHGRGRKVPVYTAGEGGDVKYPRAKTKAEGSREYKARRRWKKMNFASVKAQV